MLNEKEKSAIREFCTQDQEGLLPAFGILEGEELYRETIGSSKVIPFWSQRENARIFAASKMESPGLEVVDLDVIFIVDAQFKLIRARRDLVGINWSTVKKEWWGKPTTEIEKFIREELDWPSR